jgi:hypothetical protein
MASAWGLSFGKAWGAAWGAITGQGGSKHGFEMVGRKVYIKRGKKIHIFDTVADADAWADAEQAAIDAIAKAQKPTRNAKKRAVRRVNARFDHETLDLIELDRLVEHFGVPVELPTLEAKQDWLEVARIALLVRELQDEEDIEMLLMA